MERQASRLRLVTILHPLLSFHSFLPSIEPSFPFQIPLPFHSIFPPPFHPFPFHFIPCSSFLPFLIPYSSSQLVACILHPAYSAQEMRHPYLRRRPTIAPQAVRSVTWPVPSTLRPRQLQQQLPAASCRAGSICYCYDTSRSGGVGIDDIVIVIVDYCYYYCYFNAQNGRLEFPVKPAGTVTGRGQQVPCGGSFASAAGTRRRQRRQGAMGSCSRPPDRRR